MAFQELVMELLLYCQLTCQPLVAVEPSLVMRMAPVNPEPHWLVTTYSQPAIALVENSNAEASIPVTVAARFTRVQEVRGRALSDFSL